MGEWKDFLVELAKKLTPWLALAVLIFLLGIMFGDRLPDGYQAVPTLLALVVLVLAALIEFARLRSQRAKDDSVKIEGGADGAAVSAGNRGLLLQIVNNYAREKPDVQKAALQQQLAEYLDWVCETFGVIVLRGIEQEGRQVITLPLETVYVPLQAECQPEMDEITESLAEVRHARQMERAERHNIQLNEALSLGARLIITGGPGCGKTTVLQHIAWSLADAIRSGKFTEAGKKLGLTLPFPLPVYVPLSQYATYLRNLPPSAGGQQKALATFIADYLVQRQTNLSISSDFLAFLLRSEQNVLLLLDGLDEVPNETERVRVRQAIEDLTAGREDLRVVVTSRTAAYRGQAVLGHGFCQARVLPLAQEQIEALVRHAYRSIYHQSQAKAKSTADDLLEQIGKLEAGRRQRLGEDTPALVDTPLMVRLLLIVHFNNRTLPDQRAGLYQMAADALLRPEYALDQAVSDEIEHRVGGSLAMNREILQHLAYHMHQQGAEQGREIEENTLRSILSAEPTYAPFVDELIAQTCQRGTLLEESGGLYRFIHLSFQEFLVGRYLAQNYPDADQLVNLLQDGRLYDSWWREPLLLMVGYQDVTAPIQARRLLLRFADLDEGSARRKKRASLDACLAAVELGVSAYLECKSQADDLGNKLCGRLLALHEETAHDPWAPPVLASAMDALDHLGWLPPDLHQFVPVPGAASPKFLVACYPVTNAQYSRFLQAEDFAALEYWTGFPKYDQPDKFELLGDWGEEGWKWLQGALKEKDCSPDSKRSYPRYWNNPRLGIARRGAPVVGVTWYEANAYCKWLLAHWADLEEGQSNPNLQPQVVRLPLEREWEQAAGGLKPENRYPWDKSGEKPTSDEKEILRRANVSESGIGRTTPVGMYPLGASQPYGLHDLAGNIWEWQVNYSGHDILGVKALALRGGSFYVYRGRSRVAVRNYNHPYLLWDYLGFRVVVIPS